MEGKLREYHKVDMGSEDFCRFELNSTGNDRDSVEVRHFLGLLSFRRHQAWLVLNPRLQK